MTAKQPTSELAVGDPKSISHANTRLPDDSGAISIPPSPSHSSIAAAIDGTPYPGRDPMTPRVAGYGFVSTMPSPTPAEMGRLGMQKLMTVGKLASTPVPLRDGPFKIPPTPRREELANKMAREASKSLRSRHGNKLGLPTIAGALNRGSLTSHRKDGGEVGASPRAHDEFLSPAAKTLLGRTGEGKRLMGSRTPLRSSGLQREIDSQERVKRARWDPSPVSVRGSS